MAATSDLFAQFLNIGLDTLEVHSPDSFNDVYNGRAIDSLNAQLFPADMAHHYSETPDLFAIYKFMIDSTRMGLLARTLLITSLLLLNCSFGIKERTALLRIELGEIWGDAGDYLNKKSWLFRDTSSRHIQALIEVFQGHDNSVDNPKDTTREERYLYTLIGFTKNGLDTIFIDEEKLPVKYSELIKKKGPR